jgi:hypothetical protein
MYFAVKTRSVFVTADAVVTSAKVVVVTEREVAPCTTKVVLGGSFGTRPVGD